MSLISIWQVLATTFRTEFQASNMSTAKTALCYYTLPNALFKFYFYFVVLWVLSSVSVTFKQPFMFSSWQGGLEPG